MEIEKRIADAGLYLPKLNRLPGGMIPKFSWVRILGDRAVLSGHGPIAPDGSFLQPLGKVGEALTEQEGYTAARATALAMVASLKVAIGDLDRVVSWVRIFGMVNAAREFDRYPGVIDGCSDVLIAVFGTERGAHARSAIGVAGLPFGLPVEIEGEVIFR